MKKISDYGWVYVISLPESVISAGHDSYPERDKHPAHRTKIGYSSKSFKHPRGRQKMANFWLEALGAGEVKVHADEEHSRARSIEKLLHKRFAENLVSPCRSREVFDVSSEVVLEALSELVEEYDAQTR